VLSSNDCNCENTHNRAVNQLLTTRPELDGQPYTELMHEVLISSAIRQSNLVSGWQRHPDNIYYGIYNRRIFDPDRYLRVNDGSQPVEMAIRTPEGAELSFDLTRIPTLVSGILPLHQEEHRMKARELLGNSAVMKTEEEAFVLGQISRTGLLERLFSTASQLLIEFDPKCGPCPIRRIGGCAPEVTFTTPPGKLAQERSGLVEIQRHLRP